METARQPEVDRRSLIQLFLVSFLSLFIELLFIRWMSADIRAFNIFKTFPLVACFIGLGVGCASKNDRWFGWAPVIILASSILLKFAISFFGFDQLLPANLASYNWVESLNLSLNSWLPVTLKFMAFLVVALALPFFAMACLGTRIGVLFNKNKPLVSYAADILGALLGTIVSSLALLSGCEPSLLAAVAMMALLIPIFLSDCRKLVPVVAAIGTLVVGFAPQKLPTSTWSFWSPYQHIVLIKESDHPNAQGIHHDFYRLFVNGRPYQACWDQFLLRDPYFNEGLLLYWSRCFMPYRLLPNPGSVAIVASGMGMDLQAAIAGGAREITGVDIDPLIMEFGRTLNPNHPYQSNKVRAVCDDARHFFNHTDRKYDLIVFSHLDSQTVLGQSSSVRLDNFVYTKESFQRALKLLKDNGLLFVCFNAKKDWFRDRMYWTLAEAAGYPPIMFKDPRDNVNWSFFAVSGPLVRDHKLKIPPDLKRIDSLIPAESNVRILTDDWPYLYVQAMSADWTYILISLEILIIALLAGRKFLFYKATPGRWQLFFLGAAFLLLELQSISRLALLYGTTWVTSAVVISGVLVMILLSNALVIIFNSFFSRMLTPLYIVLGITLIASYLLPVDQIMASTSPLVGNATITIVTLLPMFLAGLIFPVSFARHKDSATAFAFNLCGSTIGALLEYQSNFTGINSLVLVSALLYLCSFMALRIKHNDPQESNEPAQSDSAQV